MGATATKRAIAATPARNRKGRRNPEDAVQAYSDFHGRGPAEVLEFEEALLKSGEYAALGDMDGLWNVPVTGQDPNTWGAPVIQFDAGDKVKLVTAPDSKGLYIVGGNQRVSADDWQRMGYDAYHRWVDLGSCYAIAYVTEKRFDGFKSSVYAHEFGEETGVRPQLWYDQETERFVLTGGEYSISPFDRKLGASPGIVN